ncbi:tRNA pseudouridine(38-40) synthase TruA [Lachnoclostridium sp.]|nr:tRNA pseudouridine(38-40) synthase TruA [Lachnoclostridium sp.]
MRNIQLIIEYDGSRYDGWQKQAGNQKSVTIQEKIEDVLNKMENETATVIGAARTEAGVHAYKQVANFTTNSNLKVYEIKQYLNRFLPRDIAVLEALEVPERFHASFNAASFEYEYKISIGEVPSVFERKYNYYCFKRPDIAKMKEAAKFLIGKHDFKAFSDNKRMKKSTEREIYSLEIYGDEKEIVITVHGDDFWPHMVRIMVGTLLEVGLSKIEPIELKRILESKDREKAGETIEAKGLFLTEVHYK